MTHTDLSRKDATSPDDAFMQMAVITASRSKDPSRQVGAVIVSKSGRVMSTGYNGTPIGWPDDKFPWGNDSDNELDTKYPYVVHAERNAVLNYGGSLRDFDGATLYTTYFPCNECAKEIVQVGIKKVVYLDSFSGDVATATNRIFAWTGVEVQRYFKNN